MEFAAASAHALADMVCASFEPAPPAHEPVARPGCERCPQRHLCLPRGMKDPELEKLAGLRFAQKRVRPGDHLFHAGQPFGFLYAVRGGSFKSTVAAGDGREQVTGFGLPGDLLGLDGSATGRHSGSAVALDDGLACTIPYPQLVALAGDNAGIQRALMQAMGDQIVRSQESVMLLSLVSAESRLASFLADISRRLRSRGYSAAEFNLRMSRRDIGSYLGLTLETVSRTFSIFARAGVLSVNRKAVRILDFDALAALGVQ